MQRRKEGQPFVPGAALVLAILIAQSLTAVVNYFSQRIQLVFYLQKQVQRRVYTHNAHSIGTHTHMPLFLLFQLPSNWLPWKPSCSASLLYRTPIITA